MIFAIMWIWRVRNTMDKQKFIIGIIYTISGIFFTISATINFLNPSMSPVTGFLSAVSATLLFTSGIIHFYLAGKNK